MIRIFDIAQNDLRQLLRDRKTFMFLLAMPIIFTVMFGLCLWGFQQWRRIGFAFAHRLSRSG